MKRSDRYRWGMARALLGMSLVVWGLSLQGTPAGDGTAEAANRAKKEGGDAGAASIGGPMTAPGNLSTPGAQRVEWCQTEVRWRAKAGVHGAGVSGACPTQGTCDTPAVRDPWIPDAATPMVTLRIKFNVFANDDGTDPAASQADVDAQLEQLNSDL